MDIRESILALAALAKECATSDVLEEEEDWVLVKDDIPSIMF